MIKKIPKIFKEKAILNSFPLILFTDYYKEILLLHLFECFLDANIIFQNKLKAAKKAIIELMIIIQQSTLVSKQ